MGMNMVMAHVIACKCCFGRNRPKDDDLERMQDVLPDEYLHNVCSFQEETMPGGWSAELRLAVSTEDGAMQWLARYQEKSMTVMRVNKTFGWDVQSPRSNLFKKSYRCHHSTRSQVRKKNLKGTDCLSCMTITVKKVAKLARKSRSTDPHITAYPMRVCLRYNHNHPVKASSALRFRDVLPSIGEKFKGLYRLGYSPISAMDVHRMDLLLEYGSGYLHISGDRAQVPDDQWCRRLHKKITAAEKETGGRNLLVDLVARMESENAGDERVMDVHVTEENQVLVAICSKLMKRVINNVPEGHEVVIVDRCGTGDRDNLKVYLLLTHSGVGGLPVGCLITTSESTSAVKAALEMYKNLIPCGAFNNGSGPKIIMTEDCEALRNALSEVFPESVMLLCIFHMLQSAWRWLRDRKKKIEKQDRPELFSVLKSLLHCQSVPDMELHYQKAMQNAIVQKYRQFSAYLLEWYNKTDCWALCCRQDLQLQGSYTHDFSEITTRVIKELVLNRVKVHNYVQLADFVMGRMERYYERRILDVVNGSFDSVRYSRYLPQEPNEDLNIKQTSECTFTVGIPSKPDSDNIVNTLLGHCTCTSISAEACKHLNAVSMKYNVQVGNIIPISNTADKARFYYIATGSNSLPERLQPLVRDIANTVEAPDNSPAPNRDHEGYHNKLGPSESETQAAPLVGGAAADDNVKMRPEVQRSVIKSLAEHLQEDFVSVLREKMTRYPDSYIPAVKVFLGNIKKLKTDSQVVTSLVSFGSSSGTGTGSRPQQPGQKRMGAKPTDHTTPHKTRKLEETVCHQSGSPATPVEPTQSSGPEDGCSEIQQQE
ncbi:uncharacterized protein LOC119737460 [Patiria miniata]|uniref:SWIM-type domain-containing protein n=1 Tax=Patiria miniata TaxID=46514 RepID=A0A914AVP7_PATMI|nr:uncharacterized protein LOC119737460 [Patiria miniata]